MKQRILAASLTALLLGTSLPVTAENNDWSWQENINASLSQGLATLSREAASKHWATQAEIDELVAASQAFSQNTGTPQVASEFSFNHKHYNALWQQLTAAFPQQNISCKAPELVTANLALLEAELLHNRKMATKKQTDFVASTIHHAQQKVCDPQPAL